MELINNFIKLIHSFQIILKPIDQSELKHPIDLKLKDHRVTT